MVTAKNEQETIILYSRQEDKWHISTDVPKHIRKYLPRLISPEIREENGQIIYIEGYLEGTVGVRKKIELSAEQKAQRAERLRKSKEENSNG